ncbi:DUF924 family protein [Vibrio sp. 10N.261.55.A7]|uniref:DUF924 family protein n=1 Tax=Vibrio sp. 10N.261.55.A7 TaxID=1880851 RepID=UPI000C819BFB|nr:DUF924 family protein [Vibrio sp. 10N.261.55.A7]PMJ99109.1 hypothetical protein BCU12_03905 [Vibrio sp. 10N.261.55.A7]
MDYRNVLTFWFEELGPSKWWVKDENVDNLIKKKFGTLLAQASQCELFEWRTTPHGRLAEIIVLDQFSRNVYRDSPKSFASDTLALSLAQEAVRQGLDEPLTQIERTFLYMPFMHSESLAIHDIAVELFKKNGVESNIEFEKKHRDIIERFGRYPHRNIILNRLSTKAEVEFLKQPNSSF